MLVRDRNRLRGSCELMPFWLKPLLCPSSSSFDHRKFKFSHPPTPELSSENLHTTNPECDLDPTLLGSPSRSPLYMDASKHRARCSGFENSSKRYIPNRIRNSRRTLPLWLRCDALLRGTCAPLDVKCGSLSHLLSTAFIQQLFTQRYNKHALANTAVFVRVLGGRDGLSHSGKIVVGNRT